MQPDHEAPGRLGSAMNERRLQLRLKWNQVAERADLSVAHLSRIRKGESLPSPLAARGLEKALEWHPGTVQQILASEDPPRSLAHDEAEGPGAAAGIENPSPAESMLLSAMAAMQEELRLLREQVTALNERSEQNRDIPHQKGA